MKTNSTFSKMVLLICVLTAVNNKVLAAGINTWLGVTSNWDDPANWSLGHIPDATETAFLMNTMHDPIIRATPLGPRPVGNVIMESDVTLTLNNALHLYETLWMGGDIGLAVVRGPETVHLVGLQSVMFAGKTQFDYLTPDIPGTATITGTVQILKALQLEGGIVDVTSGGELIFVSEAADQMGILNNFNYTGGALTNSGGSIKAQRFVSVSAGPYMVGAPLQLRMDQFGANSASGPYIPAELPCDETRASSSSPNGMVWGWNEAEPHNAQCVQSGWYAVPATTAATPGMGYLTRMQGGDLLIFEGLPNQAETYTVNGLANSGWTTETVQSMAEPFNYGSGWHLLGNPFLAPYDMQSGLAHNAGFDDACIFNNGTYQPLIVPAMYNGVPNSGVVNTGYLAPFQGVMVHRGVGGNEADPLPPTAFTFNRSDCNELQSPRFYKDGEGQALAVSVNGNGFSDVTYIGFNPLASALFDAGMDSRKLRSDNGMPTLYTRNKNQLMAVNTFKSIAETPAVQLGLIPGNNGIFTLTFNGLENFDNSINILLEDKRARVTMDLRAKNEYRFAQNTDDNSDRFVVHFIENNISTSVNNLSNNAFKMYSSGNIMFVDFSQMQAVDATVEVFNELGQKILYDEVKSASVYSKPLSDDHLGYVMVKVTNGDDVKTGKLLIAAAR